MTLSQEKKLLQGSPKYKHTNNIQTGNSTRSSALTDKPRDAFVRYAMA